MLAAMSFLLTQLSDCELMRQVQAGRTDRFAELATRYHDALLRFSWSRCGRREWAEEIVQETFLAAIKSCHTFDVSANFRTWLWTILLNESRRHFRRHARRREVAAAAIAESPFADPLPPDQRASREPAPPVQLLAQEQSQRVDALLARLPDVEADALRLRFFAGLKFREIADAMQCALPTAKNRVRRGLVQLGEWITTEQPDLPGPGVSHALR